MTARGFGADAAESRKARRRPDRCSRSNIGKSRRRTAPSKTPALARPIVIGPTPGPSVRADGLGRARLVADAGRQAELLADPVVAVGLELVAELLSAAHHHAPIEEDVDELWLHVVEHPLVVRDEEDAHLGGEAG